jgi:hypothetical protein
VSAACPFTVHTFAQAGYCPVEVTNEKEVMPLNLNIFLYDKMLCNSKIFISQILWFNT